jgi:hypothetical protein
MRDSSYRPMLRLALFGTYTLIAIGLSEIRSLLREARVPAELKNPRPRARVRRGR